MMTADDTSTSKEKLIELARVVRFVIKVLAGALVACFGWLQLSGVDLGPVVKSILATLLLRGALVFYYFCWVLGTSSDTDDQELAYSKAPNAGRLPLAGLGIMILLGVLFGILCWVDTYEKFALALAGFWAANVAGTKLVARTVAPAIALSRGEAADEGRLEEIRLIENHVLGRWQDARFATGALIVGILNILVFSKAGSLLADVLGSSRDLILTVAIVAYIVLMESWIWYMRVRLKVGLQTILDLRKRDRFRLLDTGAMRQPLPVPSAAQP